LVIKYEDIEHFEHDFALIKSTFDIMEFKHELWFTLQQVFPLSWDYQINNYNYGQFCCNNLYIFANVSSS
jgi:hypothetical protein